MLRWEYFILFKTSVCDNHLIYLSNELKLEELVLVEHNGTPFRGGIISLECPVGLGLVQVRLVDVGEIVEVAVEKVCRLVGDFIFEVDLMLDLRK